MEISGKSSGGKKDNSSENNSSIYEYMFIRSCNRGGTGDDFN